MIKVLHVYKTYYPETMGGIEQVIFQLAEGGIAHGVESEVLFLSERGAARGEQVGHHFAHRSKLDLHIASTSFSLSAFKDFSELARKADIIHYHFPWPFMDVMHFVARVKKPTVVSYHSDIIKQKYLLSLYRPLKRRFLSSVTRIVASSPNYLKTSGVLQKFSDKVVVIPYGLNPATYPEPSAERLSYWRTFAGGRFFLFLGVLRYYKGLHILLEALAESHYPVVIAGAGPIEQELKEQAQRLGLYNVHFVGQVTDEDKAALFQLCYAVTFPSHLRSEAFGISLLEGAMYGKALISSEIGSGTTYINIDQETGLVVPPSDPVALGQALKKLWENPELAAKLGGQARLRFEKYFTAERMNQDYSRLYRAILSIKSEVSL
jgi:glycosyltransferase involved in cell wall biosynthesis